MMKIKYFVLLILLISCVVRCEEDERKKQLSQVYEKDATQYQITRYFKRGNFVEEVSLADISGLVEYYKVNFNRSNQPIEEEYYKNQRLVESKIYHYDDKKKQTIIYYDSEKRKNKEEIYQNKELVVQLKYEYDPVKKYLIKEERNVRGVPDGWWSYFDPSGRVIKKELYKSGKIESTWITQFNEKGELVREESYNSEGKLEYQNDFKRR